MKPDAPLWRIMRSWTPLEWGAIVKEAILARANRAAAKVLRKQGNIADAMEQEYQARWKEARVRSASLFRGKDIDDAKLQAYEAETRMDGWGSSRPR